MTSPRLPHSEVTRILAANGCDLSHAHWLAIRGYYLDSKGTPGQNDLGIWDDAWFLYSPQHGVVSYRANTDPSSRRAGQGTGSQKGRAHLAAGVWRYGPGLHKGRPAFRQAAQVLVKRDALGGGSYDDWGFFGINIHDAPGNGTSSEGCQTAPRAQFAPLREMFVSWLNAAQNPIGRNDQGQRVRMFHYVLIDETARRAGNIIAPNTWR